jgi:hypothetical protein
MKISETAVAIPAAAPRVVAGSGQAGAAEKPLAKDKVSIPSPQQIAQQLVGDAEVEARLRAMLAR